MTAEQPSPEDPSRDNPFAKVDAERARRDEWGRTKDPAEAEHVAHAMKPHIEQAMVFDELHDQSLDEAARAKGRDAHRDNYLATEQDELSDASANATEAADEAGDIASDQYRRDHPGEE
jgi:hypothetical protein